MQPSISVAKKPQVFILREVVTAGIEEETSKFQARMLSLSLWA